MREGNDRPAVTLEPQSDHVVELHLAQKRASGHGADQNHNVRIHDDELLIQERPTERHLAWRRSTVSGAGDAGTRKAAGERGEPGRGQIRPLVALTGLKSRSL